MIKQIVLIVSVFIVRENFPEVQIVISLLGVAVFAVTLSRISKNLLPSIKSFCKSLANKVIIKRAVIHEIKSEELLTVIAKSKTPRICFVYLWWHISEQRFTDYLPIASSETPF